MNASLNQINNVYHSKNDKSLILSYEENAILALKNSNFRVTMPRIQVIRALASSHTAMSAYEIHEKITKQGGRIDVVSVYRVLVTLQEVGLIYKVGMMNGFFPNLNGAKSANKSSLLINNESSEVHCVSIDPAVYGSIEKSISALGFDPKQIRIEVLADKK